MACRAVAYHWGSVSVAGIWLIVSQDQTREPSGAISSTTGSLTGAEAGPPMKERSIPVRTSSVKASVSPLPRSWTSWKSLGPPTVSTVRTSVPSRLCSSIPPVFRVQATSPSAR